MYILQGDLGFIFNPHKEIRPPPPPFFQKSDLSLPNTSPLSRNNLRLFANNPALLRNTRALLKVHKKSRTFCALFLKKVGKDLDISKIICTFAEVIEITSATIGYGSEKLEQARFSLALRDGCKLAGRATRCSWSNKFLIP